MSKAILWIVMVLALLLLVLWSLKPDLFGIASGAKASGNDKCKPASGYTEQEWLEHMSHHPDIYAECLGART